MTWGPLPTSSPELSPIAPGRPVAAADVVGLEEMVDETVRRMVGEGIRFDSAVDGTNLSLTGSFQTAADLAFSLPSGWIRYRAQLTVAVMVAGVTSGDAVLLAALASGETGAAQSDNSASTTRFLVAHLELDSESTDITLLCRVRNDTAARGTVYTSWAWLTAVRTR